MAGSTCSSAASTGSGPTRTGRSASREPDPRNRCRLYHNQGNGTFVDVAAKAGVQNERWAKGSAWGDYDDDGRLDLFVSNMEGPARLYHNQGDGTFLDVAPDWDRAGPRMASLACSGTTTTTAGSISSSATTAAASPSS